MSFTDQGESLLEKPMDKSMDKSELSIVIIGDSNTEGYGLEAGESYPELLNLWFKKEIVVHNFGVSGTCVIQKDILGRWVGMPYVHEPAYRKALAVKGDIYIINLGTNDATDGEEDINSDNDSDINPFGNLMAYSDYFASQYEGIIEEIYAASPNAKIMVCLPIPIRNSIWRKHKQIYLEVLAQDIRSISEKRNLKCIDLMDSFLQIEDIDRLYLSDGLHLNSKGAAYVAKIIKEALCMEGLYSESDSVE